MFQGAKRRITEGARRAARGSGGVSGSQRDQQAAAAAATTRSGDSAQDVMDLMLDSGERGRMQHRTSHMSNGKGPSSSNMGGSGAHNAYFVDDDVVSNDMDMDFFDYGDRLGGGGGGGGEQMFSLASMEESIFSGVGGIGGSGGSMFGPGGAFFSGRGMRLGGQHGGREPVDKVVHTDFFNKFDDLLDMDDLD